jgi:hypothetical protein
MRRASILASAWVTAASHYTPDMTMAQRQIDLVNDPETIRESLARNGGYYKDTFEIVPISDIDVPEVWNTQREQRLQQAMPSTPLPPVQLSRSNPNQKWQVSDGIHRINVSLQQGFTHVPAIISEWVDAPDGKIETNYPTLQVGDTVKLKTPEDGLDTARITRVLPAVGGIPRYEVEPIDPSGQWWPPIDVSALDLS